MLGVDGNLGSDARCWSSPGVGTPVTRAERVRERASAREVLVLRK
jgi:hypothetical protein